MQEKKPFGARMEAFFAGKGFYIVLLLCVSVIGVSVWSMLSGAAREKTEFAVSVAGMDEAGQVSDAAPASPPAPTAPKPTPAPVPTEAPASADA
ncbi:MAG: M23 family peptidase, partial [Oscillospiraceae bacterium]|nr:M23 family peptidase [Oscillospiraceae bacterium]